MSGYQQNAMGYYPIDMTRVGHPTMAPVPMGQAQAPQAPRGWLRQEVGGLQLWQWAVGLAAVGGSVAAYAKYRETQGEEKKKAAATLAANSAPWSPSRSRIAGSLSDWLRTNGGGGKCVVIHDADEAKKRHAVKNPSPLVNLKVPKSMSLEENSDFKSMLDREGLKAVRVEEGVVGLVPNGASDRSKEWERYVDALREEGQKV